MLTLRFYLKELIHNKTLALAYLGCLGLGLVGFLTVEAFNDGISSHLQLRSKSLLDADVGIFPPYELTEEERTKVTQLLPQMSESRNEIRMFGMLSTGSEQKLVRIIGVEPGFPYYSELETANNFEVSRLYSEPTALLYPELGDQLGLKIGDDFTIGTLSLKVGDWITDDTSEPFSSFSAAPRIIVARSYLEKSGLIGFGSRVDYQWLIKTEEKIPLLDIKNVFKDRLDVRAEDHTSQADRTIKTLSYTNDYLKIVALIAIFLSGVGSAFLSLYWVELKLKQAHLVKLMGGNLFWVIRGMALQFLILSATATLFAVLVTNLTLPQLVWLLKDLLPEGWEIGLSNFQVFKCFLIASGSLGLFSITGFWRLFQGSLQGNQREKRLKLNIAIQFVGVLGYFWLLSFLQAYSFKTANYFTLGLMLSISFFSLCVYLLILFLKSFSLEKSLAWGLALLSVSRKPNITLSFMVALSLSVMVIHIPIQLKELLVKEFEPSKDQPSLFMMDIQEDQWEQIESKIHREYPDAKILSSPWVRGRLTAKNDVEVALQDGGKTKEAEIERRFTNRTFNLSARKQLFDSEKLVGGSWEAESDLPHISLDENLASNLNINLGDKLTFIVEGIPIDGRVLSFRKVKWSSLQPNFLVQFKPGVLDELPKIFIASVSALTPAQKTTLQKEVVKDHPNVSMIDVSRTITKFMAILNQLSNALFLISSLATFAGCIVMASMVVYLLQEKRKQVGLLKLLGIPHFEIGKSIGIELSIHILGGIGLGSLVSWLILGILQYNYFREPFTPFWIPFLGVSGIMISACSLVAAFFLRQSLVAKPLDFDT